jgi:hypothetical protein
VHCRRGAAGKAGGAISGSYASYQWPLALTASAWVQPRRHSAGVQYRRGLWTAGPRAARGRAAAAPAAPPAGRQSLSISSSLSQRLSRLHVRSRLTLNTPVDWRLLTRAEAGGRERLSESAERVYKEREGAGIGDGSTGVRLARRRQHWHNRLVPPLIQRGAATLSEMGGKKGASSGKGKGGAGGKSSASGAAHPPAHFLTQN